ncbi:MAG: LysR family transcriptional regulator [Acidiferrobacterales bacterium]
MDTLGSMRVFSMVTDLGSFTAAAERLGMAPSAVTKHVAALEARLGVLLLNRTTRRLSLTEAGTAYLDRCNALLADLDGLEASVGELVQKPIGTLRLTAPVPFGISHLGPIIAAYRERYPDVNLELVLNDRMIDLVEEGFDLAIRIARLPDSSLVARQLAVTRMVLCAAPRYLQRRGAPRKPEDLVQHDCLSYTYWGTGDEWRFTQKSGQIRAIRIKPVIRVNNGDVARTLALAGQGIMLQPDFLVGNDIETGRLVRLLPGFHAGELGIFAVYPHRKYLSVKVRSFVDFIAQALRRETL